MLKTSLISSTPERTFEIGRELGGRLTAGDIVLLTGGLGAGKTLFTKGVLGALGFDVDEVTSPSFALVNLYQAERHDVYHIDLWRLDNTPDPAEAVGLDEILENPAAIAVIEWADRLGVFTRADRAFSVTIKGDGDEPRQIDIVAPREGRKKS